MRHSAWPLGTLVMAGLVGGCGSSDTATLDPLRLTLSTDELDFGPVEVGQRMELDVQIINEAQGELTVQVSGDTALERGFDFTPDRLELRPSQARVVRVGFEPTESGRQQATLELTAADQRVGSQTVSLDGRGISGCEDLIVSPSRIDFGNGVVETRKLDEITLENQGEATLQVVFQEGDNVGDCDGASGDVVDFCVSQSDVSGTGRITVPAGQTVSVVAGFRPVVAGASSGFVGFSAADGCAQTRVSFVGTGVETGFACPEQIDFGTVLPDTCGAVTISCQNLANTPITVTDWGRRPGSDSTLRVEPFGDAVPLEEGDEVTFTAEYCPTAVGELSGAIRVTTDGDPETVDVNTVGEAGGPNLELSTTEVAYGPVATLVQARRFVTAVNTGFATLEVAGVESDDMDLSISPTSFVLAPGESIELEVTLEAFTSGPFAGTLTFNSNDTDFPALQLPVTATSENLGSCSFTPPLSVALGTVEVGRTASRSITVRNENLDDCLITGARIRSASGDQFSLAAPIETSIRIPPGESGSIEVSFSPDQAVPANAVLDLDVTDRSGPFKQIELRGAGLARAPFLFPDRVDFGPVSDVCGGVARTVRVHNPSSDSIIVTGVSLAVGTSPGISISTSIPPNTQISPSGTAELTLSFAPTMNGVFSGALTVEGTRPGGTWELVSSISGRRTTGAEITETFQQAPDLPVDILVLTDFTQSQHLGRVQTAGLVPLVQVLLQQNRDWQVAATSSDLDRDMGALLRQNGAPGMMEYIVRPETTNREQVWDSILSRQNAFHAINTFEAAVRVFTAPNLLGDNSGFLRDEAALGVVFLVTRTDAGQIPAAWMRDFLWSLKGQDRRNEVFVGVFASPDAQNCNPPFSQPNARITSLVDEMAGIQANICDGDYIGTLGQMGTRIAGVRQTFFLRVPADPVNVNVEVDGVPVLPGGGAGTNWTYDAAASALQFEPDRVPEPGAEIEISYVPACPL